MSDEEPTTRRGFFRQSVTAVVAAAKALKGPPAVIISAAGAGGAAGAYVGPDWEEAGRENVRQQAIKRGEQVPPRPSAEERADQRKSDRLKCGAYGAGLGVTAAVGGYIAKVGGFKPESGMNQDDERQDWNDYRGRH